MPGALCAGYSHGDLARHVRLYAPPLLRWFERTAAADAEPVAGRRACCARTPREADYGASITVDVRIARASMAGVNGAAAGGVASWSPAACAHAATSASGVPGGPCVLPALLRRPDGFAIPACPTSGARLALRGVVLTGSVKSAAWSKSSRPANVARRERGVGRARLDAADDRPPCRPSGSSARPRSPPRS